MAMLMWIPICVFLSFILLFIINLIKRDYQKKNYMKKKELENQVNDLLKD
jgi:hypothetical protein